MFVVSMPTNTIRLPGLNLKTSSAIRYLIPEGWSFFTRDPQEHQTSIYRIEGEEMILVNTPNSSTSNSFGISKRLRAINIEIGILLTAISGLKWSACNESELRLCSNKLSKKGVIESLVNENPYPILCGEFFLAKSKPIPWAWSKSMTERMPTEVLRIKIECL